MSNWAVEYFGNPPPERIEYESRYTYTAAASQTNFSAIYKPGYVDVYVNGLKKDPRSDFTATDGASVSLTVGATSGDVVQLICRRQVPSIDSYTRADADATFRTIAGSYSNTQVYTKTEVDAIIVPVGGIIIWSGSIASLSGLANWKLCDGTNGTPNLRDKFIVGAGNTYGVAANGGTTTNTLTAANLPAHTHNYNGNTNGQSASHTHGIMDNGHSHGPLGANSFVIANSPGGFDIVVTGGSGESAHGYNGSTSVSYTGINSTLGPSTDHTHYYSGTTDNGTGAGTAVNNLPPYYALAYIMRVA